jgi:hypothetical protein
VGHPMVVSPRSDRKIPLFICGIPPFRKKRERMGHPSPVIVHKKAGTEYDAANGLLSASVYGLG